MSSPIAYFLTYRTYGTWLHGDVRGSVDPAHNRFGTPMIPHTPKLESRDTELLRYGPLILNKDQRVMVHDTIIAVATYKRWKVHALNVRTNHVHAVVNSMDSPERVMNTLKSWATRRMVEAGLVEAGRKAWARHGSARYLWTRDQLAQAMHYVLHEQGKAI